MNNPHIEMAEAYASYSQNEKLKLEDRQIYATLAPAEAALAVAYELRQNRQQAEQGPSQTGAAFLIPGTLVTVNNPRSEWYGAIGRVHAVGDSRTAVEFTNGLATWIDNNNLKKADDK